MYDYRSVVTFGGWNEDLMIVVNQLIESAPHHYEHRTDKLLFLLPKHKVGQRVTRKVNTVYFSINFIKKHFRGGGLLIPFLSGR